MLMRILSLWKIGVYHSVQRKVPCERGNSLEDETNTKIKNNMVQEKMQNQRFPQAP